MQEQELIQRIVEIAQDTKAEGIVLFDMDKRSPFTDYVIVCSGRSQAHVRGIADNIEFALKQANVPATAIEGQQEGSWVLMDFSNVIVHIFHPETRTYYNLEELLQDYPRKDYDSGEDHAQGKISSTPATAQS